MRSDAAVTVVGSPASRRVADFVAAVERSGGRANVISFFDAASSRSRPETGALVRLESPGECAAAVRVILCSGIAPLEDAGATPLSRGEIDRWAAARGEIPPPRQWFLGFRALLERWQMDWPDVRWMSTPASIVTAFDKMECLRRWSRAGLPVPPRFDGIANYAELRARVRDRHARLFIKLRYGYSAVGAMALEWQARRVRLITTLDVDWSTSPPRWFLSKRPRVWNSEAEAARLVDLLGREEILVEAWLPKARWNALPFDLRLVVIGGQLRHVVGRAGSSPFTNLNLDARRVPREAVEQRLGETWPRVESTAELAAREIPGALVLGIDLLVRSDLKRLALLEANAFGDYLPGLTDRGESTYEAEWKAVGTAVEEPV
jgi:hypothetical protein